MKNVIGKGDIELQYKHITEVFKSRQIDLNYLCTMEFFKVSTSLLNKKDRESIPIIYKKRIEGIKDILKYFDYCFKALNISVNTKDIYNLRSFIDFFYEKSISTLNSNSNDNGTLGKNRNNNNTYKVYLEINNPYININIMLLGTNILSCKIHKSLTNENGIINYTISLSENLYSNRGLDYYEKVTYELREEIVKIKDGKIENILLGKERYLPTPKWLISLYAFTEGRLLEYIKKIGYKEISQNIFIKEKDEVEVRILYKPDNIFKPLLVTYKDKNSGNIIKKVMDLHELIYFTEINPIYLSKNSLLFYYNLYSDISEHKFNDLEFKLRKEYDEMITKKKVIH